MTRSKKRSGRFPTVKPRYSPNESGVGRRNTVPETITTGSSAGGTPTSTSRRSTSASWSGSSHSCGTPMRARNSRIRTVSGENREPTTRRGGDPPSNEGGEDGLAEAGLHRQYPPQLGHGYDDHLARLGDAGRHEHSQSS